MNAAKSLTPSQLSDFLLNVAVVRPVFIWGPPGIGKSSLVNRFSEELGLPCVSLLGSQLAPDLRHSLEVGMKQRDFLSIAMAGKKEQGMPAWAGFLSEDDVVHIFRYVKGRSLDLVLPGRPPSAQD